MTREKLLMQEGNAAIDIPDPRTYEAIFFMPSDHRMSNVEAVFGAEGMSLVSLVPASA